MSLTTWSWIFLVFYILMMVGIGIYAQRKIKHADDFATARGAYGPFFLALAFAASTASGATFLGSSALSYEWGFAANWGNFLYPIGVYFGILISMRLIATAGNRFGNRSIPEYLGDRYQSEGIRILVSILSLILFFYLAGQLVSGVVMFEIMLGLDAEWALVITTIVLLFYVVLGGAHADILTDGRIVFGVGRGYHTREVESLGGPMLDKEANREIFEEQVDILFKAFHQESFSHKGKYYTLPPKVPYRGYELEELTLVPRPKNLPVECWQPVVSATDRGLDFMIKHGIKGVIGGGAALLAEGPIQSFQQAHIRAGQDVALGENLCLGISYHLAPTKEQAISEAEKYYQEHAKMFGPLGFLGRLKPEQVEALGERGGVTKSGIPTLAEACETASWYCGPPEGFIEFLKEVGEKFPGLDHVNVQSAMGTPESVMIEQLEWFGKEIIPAFQ